MASAMMSELPALLPYLSEQERAELDSLISETTDRFPTYEDWIEAALPEALAHALGQRHHELWTWAWGIHRDEAAPPFVGIWPRGGGKSTTSEAIAAMLGATGRRRYALYVSETQDQADDHVAEISGHLQTSTMAALHPATSRPRLNRHGNSQGWRRNRVHTDSGFVVDAMGLDSARRGAKIEGARPDLIVLDDIDAKHDSADTTRRKVRTITESILPAGANHVAVLAVQNLVIPTGVFAMLANHPDAPDADFLTGRILSGPHVAVDGLEVEKQDDRWVITAGTATWAGQSLDACEHLINSIGVSAFRRESQHEVEDEGGLFAGVDFQHHPEDSLPEIVRSTVWCDPAVTNKDGSDSHGIIGDSLGVDDKIYRRRCWEDVTSPQDALERAILMAVEIGSTTVGVETDQGGDTWRSVYQAAVDALRSDGRLPKKLRAPRFREAKAGAGHGPKVERATRMLAAYERGEIRHVTGHMVKFERALRRFPLRKPFDLVDAAYWSWHDLAGGPGLQPGLITMKGGDA